MALTPTDPAKAQIWLRGEAPNQILDVYVPRGARGEIGPVGPQGPAVPTNMTVADTVTGPETAGATGPQGPQGVKGDPGGLTFGTAITVATDWNDLKADGIYRATASTGVNSPPVYAAQTYGTLIVTSSDGPGTRVVQTYYPATSGTGGKFIMSRAYAGGVWYPWGTFASTRVDETAGRAFYQWDNTNGREQLTYGDTGWRQIAAANADAFPTGAIRIRRVGSTVFVRTAGLYTGASGAAVADLILSVWPTGFTPDADMSLHMVRNMTNGAIGNIRITDAHMMNYTAQAANSNLAFSASFPTSVPWPTTLPGTAAGAIPSA